MKGASFLVFIVFSMHHVFGYGLKFNNINSPSYQQPAGYWSGYSQQPLQYEVQPKEDEEDPEYMYELLFGHQIRDIEKYKRQKGCLCNNRFRDPHCGSDYKVYDNGCYFQCAQDRTPGLKLLKWGKC